jgi:hypothetical protein
MQTANSLIHMFASNGLVVWLHLCYIRRCSTAGWVICESSQTNGLAGDALDNGKRMHEEMNQDQIAVDVLNHNRRGVKTVEDRVKLVDKTQPRSLATVDTDDDDELENSPTTPVAIKPVVVPPKQKKAKTLKRKGPEVAAPKNNTVVAHDSNAAPMDKVRLLHPTASDCHRLSQRS